MENPAVRLPDVVPCVRFSDASIKVADAVLELGRAKDRLYTLRHVLDEHVGHRYCNMLMAVIGTLGDISAAAHVAVATAK